MSATIFVGQQVLCLDERRWFCGEIGLVVAVYSFGSVSVEFAGGGEGFFLSPGVEKNLLPVRPGQFGHRDCLAEGE